MMVDPLSYAIVMMCRDYGKRIGSAWKRIRAARIASGKQTRGKRIHSDVGE